MNLSPVLVKAFQDQFTAERNNEAFYWQCALCLDDMNWSGFAKWMSKAANEEKEHAQKFADYLIDRNVCPDVESLASVVHPTGDVMQFFGLALQAEQANTLRLNRLFALCQAENDYDAQLWLQWALNEQRVSERELTDLLKLLERSGGNNAALLEIDEHINDA